jgi:hypothetical protein
MRAATQEIRAETARRVDPINLHFQEGYSKGEEWVLYTGEPSEVHRLKQFCRELSLNGQTPAQFVELDSANHKYKPEEMVALYVLGPHFKDDPGAAADWWRHRGGDISMPNFVAGFMTGVAETD